MRGGVLSTMETWITCSFRGRAKWVPLLGSRMKPRHALMLTCSYYCNVEGIDAADGKVFFVSKEYKRLVILDLAKQIYVYSSTASGTFADQPDQVGRLVHGNESALFFARTGAQLSGVRSIERSCQCKRERLPCTTARQNVM